MLDKDNFRVLIGAEEGLDARLAPEFTQGIFIVLGVKRGGEGDGFQVGGEIAMGGLARQPSAATNDPGPK